MNTVYITGSAVVTPLGFGVTENLTHLLRGNSAIRQDINGTWTASFSNVQQESWFGTCFSRENPACSTMLNPLLEKIVQQFSIPVSDPKTGWILCSTKGNIETLDESMKGPSPLQHFAIETARFWGLKIPPVVISNACISGLNGLIHGQRLIAAGIYDTVIVAAADAASEFVAEGFQSLQAVSTEPCRPFDISRNGISLGEAAAVIVLSKYPAAENNLVLWGGFLSNDANHISGPSRDGSGLSLAIRNTLETYRAVLSPENTFIAAHGTGTLYNDEMEALAFYKERVHHIPTISYKGYFGHTLGASGLLETAIGIESLTTGMLPASKGYVTHGVTVPIAINTHNLTQPFRQFLKTGSGFGGCNAAIWITRENL